MRTFPVTKQEYEDLYDKFGGLLHFAGWQLLKRNNRNNHTEDEEDFAQELQISLLRAASYYKRQVYIEKCLELCKEYATDPLTRQIVKNLAKLWKNKTRHGASRQKFGPHQENALDKIVQEVVPKKLRPSKDEPLQIDQKFSTYCKAITWNAGKSMGKKISREKDIRSNMISLSSHDFLI